MKRFYGILGALGASWLACSQEDTTVLARQQYGARPNSETPIQLPPASAGAPDAGVEHAGSPDAAVDAAVEQDASIPVVSPCPLHIEWSNVKTSAPGCVSFSAALATGAAVWTGERLQFLGAQWTSVSGEWKRGRSCLRGATEQWRFRETLNFDEPLPPGHCPAASLHARYHYDECPLLTGGLACPEPTACTFEAEMTVSPESTGSAPVIADAGAPSSESACHDLLDLGAPCVGSLDCAEGAFCSREEPDGGCTPLGEGICVAAPQLACPEGSPDECTCNGVSIEQERVCLCDQPPIEIPGVNACFLRATGATTLRCQ